MGNRIWLAGAAAVTLAGTLPAAAQAPRSLFEATPAPTGSAPVTLGLDRAPAAKPAKSAAPVTSASPAAPKKPTTSASLSPAKPVAAGKPSDATPALPTTPAKASADARRSRHVAHRAGGSQTPLAPFAGSPLTTPPPIAGAPAATPDVASRKPMSRAERRRARREAKSLEAATAAAAALPAPPPPNVPTSPFQALFGGQPGQQAAPTFPSAMGRSQIDALVARHARLNNVPEALVHRIIVRESKYNPRAIGRGGAMGLMQIKAATARGVGYPGGSAGLLDAETNLTYGIKYLAGAWRVSGGNYDRAVMHYARGYYYEAKRQGFAGRRGRRGHQAEPETTASAPQTPSFLTLFAPREAAAQ